MHKNIEEIIYDVAINVFVLISWIVWYVKADIVVNDPRKPITKNSMKNLWLALNYLDTFRLINNQKY